MFDIGFFEILVIGLVALLVVGPERLPGLARDVGRWVGKTRRFVNSVRSDVEKEFATDELKQMMREQNREIDRLKSLMEDTEADLKRDVDEIDRTIQREVSDQKELIRNLEHDAMIPGVRRQPVSMSSDGSLTEAPPPEPTAALESAPTTSPGDVDPRRGVDDASAAGDATAGSRTASGDVQPPGVHDPDIRDEADPHEAEAGRTSSRNESAHNESPRNGDSDAPTSRRRP